MILEGSVGGSVGREPLTLRLSIPIYQDLITTPLGKGPRHVFVFQHIAFPKNLSLNLFILPSAAAALSFLSPARGASSMAMLEWIATGQSDVVHATPQAMSLPHVLSYHLCRDMQRIGVKGRQRPLNLQSSSNPRFNWACLSCPGLIPLGKWSWLFRLLGPT